MEYLRLILGFALLIKGADIFVEGSSNLAKFFRIPTIIIGLTLVAFGTSAPETAVSLTALISGNADIAISNVLGSNIFNLLCVLGITALFKDIIADKDVINNDYKLSILSAILLLILILVNYFFTDKLILSRIDGLLLLIVLFLYLSRMIKGISNEDKKKIEIKKFSFKDIIFIVVGLASVIFGGDLTVDNAVIIARDLGLSDRFIGLSIVAIGTSLPELCTSLIALFKGENDIAVGNVIGSNIFNILFILGSNSLVSPLNMEFESIIDLIILIVLSISVLVFYFRDYRIKRYEAFSMLFFYFLYFIYIFLR